jgi:hypothetical protein
MIPAGLLDPDDVIVEQICAIAGCQAFMRQARLANHHRLELAHL